LSVSGSGITAVLTNQTVLGTEFTLTDTRDGQISVSVTAVGDGEIYTDGTAKTETFTATMVVPPLTYLDLVDAVNKRIGIGIQHTGLRARRMAGNDELFDMNILIGTDGIVRAHWNNPLSDIPGHNRDLYAEYTIPGVSVTSTIEEWIAAVANMPVPMPDTTNFNNEGSLPLADAQILFDHALAQRGNTAARNLLTGAQVKLIESATTEHGGYRFQFIALASDGMLYPVTATFQTGNASSIYFLATDLSRSANAFGRNVPFTPVSTLFPSHLEVGEARIDGAVYT
jgi:hypothetical protein